MSRAGGRPERVRMPYVEHLADRLSPRDWSIVSTVDRLRLATGSQLERLHFHELTGRSRSVKRGQVLKRLVKAGVLAPLPRRVGTALLGSAEQRYALDAAGQQLARLQVNQASPHTRARRPRVPSDRFVAHALAVTQLYVELAEGARAKGFTIREFQVEGDAYWPTGQGGWIKMDAFAWLQWQNLDNFWWYEADMGTEDLSTIRGKALTYLDFVRRGQLGPDGALPWVLFGVPDRKRQESVQGVLGELPEPAGALFRVTHISSAAQLMIDQVTRK